MDHMSLEGRVVPSWDDHNCFAFAVDKAVAQAIAMCQALVFKDQCIVTAGASFVGGNVIVHYPPTPLPTLWVGDSKGNPSAYYDFHLVNNSIVAYDCGMAPATQYVQQLVV